MSAYRMKAVVIQRCAGRPLLAKRGQTHNVQQAVCWNPIPTTTMSAPLGRAAIDNDATAYSPDYDDLLFGPAPVLAQEPGSRRRFSENLLRVDPADLIGGHALLGRTLGIDPPPLRIDVGNHRADL